MCTAVIDVEHDYNKLNYSFSFDESILEFKVASRITKLYPFFVSFVIQQEEGVSSGIFHHYSDDCWLASEGESLMIWII